MFEIANAFVASFFQLFSGSVLLLMTVGIVSGFAVGILPGLGGPTTLALMLPFIFQMKPIEAFAFLLGMAAVTATTGDITSILFGIPGEPTTALRPQPPSSTAIRWRKRARPGAPWEPRS